MGVAWAVRPRRPRPRRRDLPRLRLQTGPGGGQAERTVEVDTFNRATPRPDQLQDGVSQESLSISQV